VPDYGEPASKCKQTAFAVQPVTRDTPSPFIYASGFKRFTARVAFRHRAGPAFCFCPTQQNDNLVGTTFGRWF
jgi:hypothetical protein